MMIASIDVCPNDNNLIALSGSKKIMIYDRRESKPAKILEAVYPCKLILLFLSF